MNIPDTSGLAKHVKEMRKLGFGFAVDDAGAGYASFTLIAALRPSIIKIDREIIRGIGDKRGDAKQALVEAFVSFGRRIGAELVAEGIETRRELIMLRSLGVTYGQGYLLGKPSPEPAAPRPLASLLPGGSLAGDADEDAEPKKRARVERPGRQGGRNRLTGIRSRAKAQDSRAKAPGWPGARRLSVRGGSRTLAYHPSCPNPPSRRRPRHSRRTCWSSSGRPIATRSWPRSTLMDGRARS